MLYCSSLVKAKESVCACGGGWGVFPHHALLPLSSEVWPLGCGGCGVDSGGCLDHTGSCFGRRLGHWPRRWRPHGTHSPDLLGNTREPLLAPQAIFKVRRLFICEGKKPLRWLIYSYGCIPVHDLRTKQNAFLNPFLGIQLQLQHSQLTTFPVHLPRYGTAPPLQLIRT